MDGIKRLTRKLRRKVVYHGCAQCADGSRFSRGSAAIGGSACCAATSSRKSIRHSLQASRRATSAASSASSALEAFVRDPETALPAEFVRYALAKGDKCFGFVRDGALRAYGWYARRRPAFLPT
jgi:hypothetical protein